MVKKKAKKKTAKKTAKKKSVKKKLVSKRKRPSMGVLARASATRRASARR